MMNRALSRAILGLLVVAANAIVTGGAPQPPGTTRAGAARPQEVVECLREKNIGSCVTCCMEEAGAPANACARFCRLPPPPPPQSEPEP